MKQIDATARNVSYAYQVSTQGRTDGAERRDQFPLLEMFPETDGGSAASLLVLSALRTAALLDRVVARSLAPFNLHHAQFNALMLLRRQGSAGLRPSVLGDYLCVSRPNVTKLLARLKSRALIEDRPDPEDGRAVLAFATPEGVALAEKAFEALTHDLNMVVATLPAEQRVSLRTLLDDFRDRLAGTLEPMLSEDVETH